MSGRAAVPRMWMRGLASLLHGGSSVTLASCWDGDVSSMREGTSWPATSGWASVSVHVRMSWGRSKLSGRPEEAGRKSSYALLLVNMTG